jgi:6-phosphogluconolactonase (cycloisomerase 2 family)
MPLSRRYATVAAGALIGAYACGGGTAPTTTSDPLLDGEKELWVTAQATHFIKIINQQAGTFEEIALPAGSQPHMVDLSPSGAYAYIGNVGNGTINVIRSADRAIVASLVLRDFNSATPDINSHQAKPSPDGSVVLVHQVNTRRLIKIAADEANESWTVAAERTFPRGPICTVYTRDGSRAYVSLGTFGVHEIDVATMATIHQYDGIGNVQCGLSMAPNGRTVYVTDNNSGGRIWAIDVDSGSLSQLAGGLGIADLHGSALDEDESKLHVSGRRDETFRTFDLATGAVSTVNVDLTPNIPDSPEQIVVLDDDAFLVLGNGGKLVKFNGGAIDHVWEIAPPALGGADPFLGRASHGLAIRKTNKVVNIGDAPSWDL